MNTPDNRVVYSTSTEQANQRKTGMAGIAKVAAATIKTVESSTHREHSGDGHYVTIQHCDVCDTYLGVNYPSNVCDDCKKANR